MKMKIVSAAVLIGLTSVAAHATTINIRHEYVPQYDGQDQENKDRIEVSHRFANGIGFGVEAKWSSAKGEGPFDELSGNGQQTNISYRYKISDTLTLTPQYKWDSGSTKVGHQFNLSLGYKVNDDWSVGFRHRYHYDKLANETSTSRNSHYNRWTFSAGYKGIEDWGFGASVDYTFNQESSGPRWKDDKSGFSEVNFTGEYKGFKNGWSPFAEIGMKPYKSGDTYNFNGESVTANDSWRPVYKIGAKYNY
ncbi:porin [Marinomonas sp. A3A]|jgi:oligogalacturonate-specific porin family protein|uniref:oligogalacturonate-specific porin KdgM family protein n=1 Tax=Marinomonas sp. A3A TaxID=2065312 RepID=UPI001BB3338E|nr:oligogalacturonate-specific porin KdgM family protein [Marinomonas sp. A3A]QUX90160.1 porin [Marinomonas sp. A3A]